MAEPEPDTEALEALTREAIDRIAPILRGLPPDVQGSVCANLVAMFLTGWPADVRAQLLAQIIEVVHATLPGYLQEKYGGFGHPFDGGEA